MPCKDCAYWEEINPSYGTGSCHRYPPDAVAGVRPTTYGADWCGEYEEEDEDEK